MINRKTHLSVQITDANLRCIPFKLGQIIQIPACCDTLISYSPPKLNFESCNISMVPTFASADEILK